MSAKGHSPKMLRLHNKLERLQQYCDQNNIAFQAVAIDLDVPFEEQKYMARCRIGKNWNGLTQLVGASIGFCRILMKQHKDATGDPIPLLEIDTEPAEIEVIHPKE